MSTERRFLSVYRSFGVKEAAAVRPEADGLKRKLRQLKKLEREIRFGKETAAEEKYVWSRYFSTKPEERGVRYPFETLLGMDKESLKEVIADYFSMVYYVHYRENGILHRGLYDPELLQKLGLPAGSTISDIKKRFRRLAKQKHPDYGSDSAQFIELMEVYRKLVDGD